MFVAVIDAQASLKLKVLSISSLSIRSLIRCCHIQKTDFISNSLYSLSLFSVCTVLCSAHASIHIKIRLNLASQREVAISSVQESKKKN